MFAREGYSTIVIVVIFAVLVSIGASYINHWSAYIIYAAMILLVAFILYFFRDPDREITPGDNHIISPADGNVVLIKEVEEENYIKGPATQIRSEEHTSELQSRFDLVCRLLLEKTKDKHH